jgi:hypothetical protein
VTARAAQLDGDHYENLKPAADALAAKHLRAATLVLSAMIGFTLPKTRSSRYRHAARHLMECESLALRSRILAPSTRTRTIRTKTQK